MTPPRQRLEVGPLDFDPGAEIAALGAAHAETGAIASFVGLVRRGADLTAMTLEHYPGMTEKQISAVIEESGRRWQLEGVTVLHRVGRLAPGDRIVFVGVASRHRGEAFAACEFIIDWLKTRAPFWKLEEGPTGERWVAARAEDDSRAERWLAGDS